MDVKQVWVNMYEWISHQPIWLKNSYNNTKTTTLIYDFFSYNDLHHNLNRKIKNWKRKTKKKCNWVLLIHKKLIIDETCFPHKLFQNQVPLHILKSPLECAEIIILLATASSWKKHNSKNNLKKKHFRNYWKI